MRRKTKKKYVFAALLVTALITAGCKDKAPEETEAIQSSEEKSGENSVEKTEETAATVKVTFLDTDQTTVLHEETVTSGACVEEYIPEKDGMTFMGWYATPKLTHEFDFTTPVTEDISLFGGFLTFVEDQREFYIVGSGKSPALLASNWGAVMEEAQKLTKTDSTEINEYTITLDLAEGDEFQFAMNTSWHNQRGFGYMESTSAEGKDYFSGSGGIGEASAYKSNIKCLVAGNYTFTLTTYPGGDYYDTADSYYTEENKEGFNMNPYDTLTFTYNGEAKENALETVTTYYLKGAEVTGWQDIYEDTYAMKAENGIHTLEISLKEGDEFLFTSLVTADGISNAGTEYIRFSNVAKGDSEEAVEGTESYNMVAKQSGLYTFVYDENTKELTVSCAPDSDTK